MKEDKPYLLHMLEAIGKIRGFCKGMGKEDFMKDEKTRDAVVRNFEIIGEAAKQVSSKFKSAHQEIPWAKIAGTRDKLIHNYAGVDYGIIWNVVANELPLLEKELLSAVKENSK